MPRSGALLAVLVLGLGVAAGPAEARAPTITFYFGSKRPEVAAQRAFFAVGEHQ